MWNLPGPGIKPTSPALAGRFLTCQRGGFFLVFFAAARGSVVWMCTNLFNEDMFSAGPEKAAIFKEDTGEDFPFPG